MPASKLRLMIGGAITLARTMARIADCPVPSSARTVLRSQARTIERDSLRYSYATSTAGNWSEN